MAGCDFHNAVSFSPNQSSVSVQSLTPNWTPTNGGDATLDFSASNVILSLDYYQKGLPISPKNSGKSLSPETLNQEVSTERLRLFYVKSITFCGAEAVAAKSVGGNFSQMVVTLPPNLPGMCDIVIQSNIPDQKIGLPKGVQYMALPSPSSLSVNGGSLLGGTEVTVNGSGFESQMSVEFGGTPCVVKSASNHQITCTTGPHSLGTVDVTVHNLIHPMDGILPAAFTYAPPAAITSINPTHGAAAGGYPVTISGSNFNNSCAVQVGANAITSVTILPDSISFVAPAALVNGPTSAAVTCFVGTANIPFRYDYPAPSLTNVTPSPVKAGVSGLTFTVNGNGFSNLGSGPTLYLGATLCAANLVSVTPTSFICTVSGPLAAGSYAGYVQNTDPGQTPLSQVSNSVPNAVVVNGTPDIASISPTFGLTNTGTLVTVNGVSPFGFRSASVVNVGGVPCTGGTTFINGGQLTCMTPTVLVEGPVNVIVTNIDDGQVSQAPAVFTYQYPTPIINSLSPASGILGSSTVINGSNLAPSIQVTFFSQSTSAQCGTTVTVATTGGNLSSPFAVPNDTVHCPQGTTANVVIYNGAVASTNNATFTFNFNLSLDQGSGNSVANNSNTLSLAGNCNSLYPVSVSVNGVAQSSAACSSGRWSLSDSQSSDNTYVYNFSQPGTGQTVSYTWVRDTVPPVLSNFLLSSGSASSATNYISVSLNAVDSKTNVTKFYLQYVSGGAAAPATPAANDPLWVNVNNPDQPNLTPAPTLNLVNYFYRIGFTPTSYTVYAWAMDQSGNISAPQNASIIYQPQVPPVIKNVLASSSDPVSIPLSQAQLNVQNGHPLYIYWNATAAAGWGTTPPISLYYTTDDITYQQIALSIPNAGSGSCNLNLSLMTGCYVWDSVTVTGYFRVRVAAVDKNGMVTFQTSNYLNAGSITTIAGNTDPLLGSSAAAALFVGKGYQYPVEVDKNSFVIAKDGTLFFRDVKRGLLMVRPTDGVQQLLIPLVGKQSQCLPPPHACLSANPLVSPLQIALDFNNGLLIQDYDRILRLDLNSNPMTVTTFIGGGNSTADDVLLSEVKFAPFSIDGAGGLLQSAVPLIPVPNGDIYFQSDQYIAKSGRVRWYQASTGKVISIYPSGVGDSASPTENINTCSSVAYGTTVPCMLAEFAVGFTQIPSFQLTGMQVGVRHMLTGGWTAPTANLNPSGPNIGKTVGMQQYPHDLDPYSSTFTGRNGSIYVIMRLFGATLSRYDINSPTGLTPILGGVGVGTCPDGTPALSCAVDLEDAFVDTAGNVYFFDRGLIRTIDGNGKVATLYGQGLSFGDGSLALSARFNQIGVIRQWTNPTTHAVNVVALDGSEYRLREFEIGQTINTIAGNGTNGVPAVGSTAANQPILSSYAGINIDSFEVNPNDGTVYMPRTTGVVSQINRSTGKWADISPAPLGYLPQILGFDPISNLIMVLTATFDGTSSSPTYGQFVDSFINLFPAGGGASTPFAGISGPASYTLDACLEGTAASACVTPNTYAEYMTPSQYDPVRNAWLLLGLNTNRIRVMGAGTGNKMATAVALNQNASSFAYNAANGDFYYCAAEGKIHKVVLNSSLPTDTTETTLDWPVASMACAGRSMIYNSARKSIIFPYSQNQLMGIAEYTLPDPGT